MRLEADPDRLAEVERALADLPAHVYEDGTTYVQHEFDDGVGVRIGELGGYLLDPAGRRVVTSPPDDDPAWWEQRLIGFALPSLLGELGELVLHGCAVAWDGGAVVLCGPSGRGKTTTSLALVDAGAELLNDDVTIFAPEPNGPAIWPGPRGSRVLGLDGRKALRFVTTRSAGEAAPLRAIVTLEPRGSTSGVRRIPTPDAFLALLPHRSVLSRSAQRRAFGTLADVVRRVPVYGASLPDDLAALPEAAVALLELTAEG